MFFKIFKLFKSDIYFHLSFSIPDIVLYILIFLFILLNIIGRALIFKKANKKIYKSFIPFFAIYEYYDIFWEGYYGLIEFVLALMFYILLPTDVRLLNAGFIAYLCLLLFISKTIISIIGNSKLSRSFSKNIVFTFCLIFLGSIFRLLIALGKDEYSGKIPNDFNKKKDEYKRLIKQHKNSSKNKVYMISLYKWRSIVAFVACLVTLFVSVLALFSNFVNYVKKDILGDLLRYFTINSNILVSLAAACIIPYTIEGIRKKRFSYPRWANLFHYSAVICTTLTMIFTLAFISWYNPILAFARHNFFLHIVSPIMILISFLLVESDNKLSTKDSIICLIPFFTYSLIYTIEVFIIGEENGGWADIYCLFSFIPISISAPAMFILAISVSLLIRYIYNLLSEKRKKQLKQYWPKDADPIEVKIEIYGLGRYMGLKEEINNVSLPMDIIEDMANYYSIKEDELIRSFIKGLVDGKNEKKSFKNN